MFVCLGKGEDSYIVNNFILRVLQTVAVADGTLKCPGTVCTEPETES